MRWPPNYGIYPEIILINFPMFQGQLTDRREHKTSIDTLLDFAPHSSATEGDPLGRGTQKALFGNLSGVRVGTDPGVWTFSRDQEGPRGAKEGDR